MQKRILLAAVMLAHAYAQTTASSVIRKAADALGGADRIKSLHSLRLEGYGQEAVQNGGGNTSASREAPQRWTNVLNWEETIDLTNQRISFVLGSGIGVIAHDWHLLIDFPNGVPAALELWKPACTTILADEERAGDDLR